MTDTWNDSADAYRVAAIDDQSQPEMLYQCKEGEIWVPLNEDGFWADPSAYSTGEVTKQSLMTKEQAERAIWRARLVNKVHRP